nr:DUF6711 family protein [uncultured Ruminococcus sp.]
MANSYQGYILKINGNVIPREYFTDYETTPDQRQEADAQVDQNGYLHRATMPHTRTSIRFNTRIGLTLDEKIDLQERMGYADDLHRDVEVVYWNDESNAYDSGTFYLPDITFSIMDFDDDTIHYNPISIELIEN